VPGTTSTTWPTHQWNVSPQAAQGEIVTALSEGPAGEVKVMISLCDGDGAHHPRRDDVGVRLVELDSRNTAARRGATRDGPAAVAVPLR
jgi:hypothetical protein